MELIKEAVIKARGPLGKGLPPASSADGKSSTEPAANRVAPTPTPTKPAWSPPQAALNEAYVERNRIVSYAAKDPSHVAFNLLRTKVYRTMLDNNWRSLAITSPTAGCGKTMVAINLAVSLARQAHCRTVLLDLDLKKRAVAKTLGVKSQRSISEYLRGIAEFEECFVSIGQNLTVGLNLHAAPNSAELLSHRRVDELLRLVRETLRPDIMLIDLPPVLATDDALAMMPRVDSALLVIGARRTVPNEVDQSESQLGAATKLLGVVLNKAEYKATEYYYAADEPTTE